MLSYAELLRLSERVSNANTGSVRYPAGRISKNLRYGIRHPVGQISQQMVVAYQMKTV